MKRIKISKEIKLSDYTLRLKDINNHNIILFDDSGTGKTKLAKEVRLLYSNIESYVNTSLLIDDLREIDNTKDIIIFDECRFRQKELIDFKKWLLTDKRYHIIIDRKFRLLSADYYKIYDNKLILPILTIDEFFDKFKFNYDKSKPVILLCEDSKSGLEYYQKSFTNLECKSFNGLPNLVNKLKEFKNYNILLCLDFVSDNPEILLNLNKIKFNTNVYLLNTQTVESIIALKKNLIYKTITPEDRNNLIFDLENILDEHYILNNINLKYLKYCESFEQLVTTLLSFEFQYSKLKLPYSVNSINKNNFIFEKLRSRILDFYEDSADTIGNTSYFS